MREFNEKFIANKTLVKTSKDGDYLVVKNIHDSKKLIEIKGFRGSFQFGHIYSYVFKDKIFKNKFYVENN